jgi:hypothetical protein
MPGLHTNTEYLAESAFTQALDNIRRQDMHQSVMEYVQGVANATPNYPNQSVLEVGSFDVNGSVRRIFAGLPYIGVDIRPGPGVDRLILPEDKWGEDFQVGIVVSTEMLEHDRDPWWSVQQMYSALVLGGSLILTCRGYDERGCFPIHDHPGDLWRFSVDGVKVMLESVGFFVLDCRRDPAAPGVFAHALKAV